MQRDAGGQADVLQVEHERHLDAIEVVLHIKFLEVLPRKLPLGGVVVLVFDPIRRTQRWPATSLCASNSCLRVQELHSSVDDTGRVEFVAQLLLR